MDDSENNWLDRFESERRTRPLIRAICALGQDEDHHPLNASQIAKARWPNDRETIQTIERASVIPTSTTTTGLINNAVPDLVNILGPLSTSGAVIRRAGVQLSFERYTSVYASTIIASSTGVGFIAQGSPIPMRQMSFAGPTMDPKKLALGFGATEDLFAGSNGEALTRANLSECLSQGIDALLFDAVAADTLRPAGLRNGINAITATVIGTPVLTATDAMFKGPEQSCCRSRPDCWFIRQYHFHRQSR